MMQRERVAHPITDKLGLLIAFFFTGWICAEAFYGTGDFATVREAHKKAVGDLTQLTDQVGTCYVTLAKHGIEPPRLTTSAKE